MSFISHAGIQRRAWNLFLGDPDNGPAPPVGAFRLDFDDITVPPGDLTDIGNWYGGGGGTDYGVTFSPAGWCNAGESVDDGGAINVAAPFPTLPNACALVDILGGAVVLDFQVDIPAGFDTALSFVYDLTAGAACTVKLYTLPGDVVPFATDVLATTGGTLTTVYALPFAGTCRKVIFSATNNQMALDNLTFGSVDPVGPL